MSAKLLNAFTDDNPDLQKQIGCMAGIFQVFDRHHLLNGRRLIGHNRKRLPSGDALLHDGRLQSETNSFSRQIVLDKNLSRSLNENQRVSVQSSRASFSSSSCSSSFSSLECNKSTQQEPSHFERTTFPERSLKDPPALQNSEIDSKLLPSSPCPYPQNLSATTCRQSLDFCDVVKDSIYRDTRSLSIKTSNEEEGKRHVMKHKDSPRPLPLSETIDRSYLTGKNEKPKVSVGLSKSIQVLAKLKEAPRYISEHKPTTRSSYEAKDGSIFPLAQEAPRFSYDGREIARSSVDSWESSKCSLRLRELPRLSLDSRQSSLRNSNLDSKLNSVTKDLERIDCNRKTYKSLTLEQDLDTQRQPTSVVAKLMGLEAMPSSSGMQGHTHSSKRGTTNLEAIKSSSKSLKMPGENKQERLSSSPKSSLKASIAPQLRHAESVIKPMSNSRIPIETAPWKQQKCRGTPGMAFGPREGHKRQQQESLYCEIERKLKELEFQQSSKDLRALKQILDAIKSKGLREISKDETLSSEIPEEINSYQEMAGVDQNLRKTNRQKPHTGHPHTTLMKGANTSRPLQAPIVIMKPEKCINKSSVPASSIIPFTGLSGLHRVRTGDATDMKKTTVNNRLAKDQAIKLSPREPDHQILPYLDKNSSRHREDNSSLRVRVQMAQGSPRPQLQAKENSGSIVKVSGSVSPRLQQKKLELEKKSRAPSPSSESTKSRKQSITRHVSESVSPRSKIRPKPEQVQQSGDKLNEITSDARNLNHQKDEISLKAKGKISLASQLDREGTNVDQSIGLTSILNQQGSQSTSDGAVDNNTSIIKEKKSLHDFSEDAFAELSTISLEQPSPVSVLDASFYREDLSSSPVHRISNSYTGDDTRNSDIPSGAVWKTPGPDSHLPNSPQSDLSSTMYHKKLESIENLLQKLRQLSLSNNDESPANDHMTSLCELHNPDHGYVSQVLLASGFLSTGPNGPMPPIRLHKSGSVMDPGLFLELEQTKLGITKPQSLQETSARSKCDHPEKLHRRLLFDTVNEILTRKLESAGRGPRPRPDGRLADKNTTGQQLLKELCLEIERLQSGVGFPDDEDDGLMPMLCQDVAHQSEGWKDLGREVSGLVLDMERSIFKDLINEVVNGGSAASSGPPAKPSRRRRQLSC
uniref:Protein LONGIFOLIA 2 n=1 Tax=Anthurium amnicola TaxID=1678845 RepID=A0A1D1Y8N1_9ARAE